MVRTSRLDAIHLFGFFFHVIERFVTELHHGSRDGWMRYALRPFGATSPHGTRAPILDRDLWMAH